MSAPRNRTPRADATPHGTRSKYLYGCRCQPCTDANRAYRRQHDKRAPADLAEALGIPTGGPHADH